MSQQSVTAFFPVKADAALAAGRTQPCRTPRLHRPVPDPGAVGCDVGRGTGAAPSLPEGGPAAEPRLPPLQNGVISLIDCTLVEEQESTDEDGRCPMAAESPRGTARALLSPWLRVRGWGCLVHLPAAAAYTGASQKAKLRLLQEPLR